MSLGRFPSYHHSQCGVAGTKINKMSSKSVSNQIAATGATILAAVDWEKLDGSSGKNILQEIQRGFQGDNLAGNALTKWLERREWEFEPINLIRLDYPDWVLERLTPGIDDEEPFSDGTLIEIESILDDSENSAYAVYYEKFKNVKNKHGLWACVGLKTLLYFSNNPSPDFAGKRIIAWKSAVVGKRGGKYVPSCIFPKSGVEPGSIEWLDFRQVCNPEDFTLKIYA